MITILNLLAGIFCAKLAKKTEKNISHISQQLLEMYIVTFQVGGWGGGGEGGGGGRGPLTAMAFFCSGKGNTNHCNLTV